MDWKSHVRTCSHERCTTGKLLAKVLLKTTVTSSLLVLACFFFVLVPPIFVATLEGETLQSYKHKLFEGAPVADCC